MPLAGSRVAWNYTTVLNIVFLTLAGVLLWRFFTSGGFSMLRMMNKPMPEHERDRGMGSAAEAPEGAKSRSGG